MDIHRVVKELQDERERIVAAIDSLQRLAAGNGRSRRGRPAEVDAGSQRTQAKGSS
jgi:hypothetical protein